jgi:diketogulonate reductase-like aldo/keto reductase
MNNSVVTDIARAHNATAAQILLAWVISHKGVMAIPKAGTVAHAQENAAALNITLTQRIWRAWITHFRRRGVKHRLMLSKKSVPLLCRREGPLH